MSNNVPVDIIDLGEFIIELYKKPLRLFSGEFSKYFCSLIVKNKIGVTVATINTSEVEIANLLDNIYFYIECSQDTMYSFAIDGTNNKFYTVGINKYLPYMDITPEDYIDIYSSIANSDVLMNKVARINVTNKLEELVTKLYNVYILNSDMDYDTIFALDPNIYYLHFVKK